jgi:hypothetical protein
MIANASADSATSVTIKSANSARYALEQEDDRPQNDDDGRPGNEVPHHNLSSRIGVGAFLTVRESRSRCCIRIRRGASAGR